MEIPHVWNRRLQPTVEAKPGKTRVFPGTGPCLASQDAADLVFGQVWNWTEQFFLSEAGPVAEYPDLLITPRVTLDILQSKMEFPPGKRPEIVWWNNEAKEVLIEAYVESETAEAR
jgi:hypothetical protein